MSPTHYSDYLCSGEQITPRELREGVTYDINVGGWTFRGAYRGDNLEDPADPRFVFTRHPQGDTIEVDQGARIHEFPTPYDEEGRWIVDADGLSEEEEIELEERLADLYGEGGEE